jgi:uncharacterized membrane protein YphA (DoxX/SURF4 family)
MTLRMNSLQLMKFGPLPIRILAGLTLILHGLPKITDISGVQSFFPNIGLPPELAIPVFFRSDRGYIVWYSNEDSFRSIYN